MFQKINKQLLNSSAVRWGFFIKVPLISTIKATALFNTQNCHSLESFYFSLSHCHEYVQQFEPPNKVNAFFHAAMHSSVADSALEPSILSLHHAVNWTLKHFKPCTPLAADWTASTKPLHHAIEPQSMVNLLLDMYCLMQKHHDFQLVSYMLQIEISMNTVNLSFQPECQIQKIETLYIVSAINSSLHKCSRLNLKNHWTLIHQFMNCCMKHIEPLKQPAVNLFSSTEDWNSFTVSGNNSSFHKFGRLNPKNLWTVIHPFMNCCMKQILNP